MSLSRVLVLVLWAIAVTIALGTPGASAQSPPPGGVSVALTLGDRVPLTVGMSGSDVSQLQQALTDAGDGTPVDGTFGAATQAALEAWEQAGGRVVDGIVDADDASALLAVLQATPPALPTPAPIAAPVPPPAAPTATITAVGRVIAAPGSPIRVQRMIASANHIAALPYRYGGGHGRFVDSAYDCSGSVSYALHGARLLSRTLDSTDLEHFGAAGPGRWVTIYANASHAFMVIEGLRFDTSGATAAGTRWQATPASTRGFVVRHPVGL
jgi:cell wall-associated NlpC family hydrolase